MITSMPSQPPVLPPRARCRFDIGIAAAPHTDGADRRRLPSILQQLLVAEDAEQRQQRIAAIVRAMGFDWLGYGRLHAVGDTVMPSAFRIAHGDTAWQRRYVAQSYHEVDMRVRRALRSTLPVVWQLDELMQEARHSADAMAQRFVQELSDTGMRCGVMLALPSAEPHQRTLVSLLAREPEAACLADDRLFSQVLTLGVCLQEYYTYYAVPAEEAAAPAAVLSPTQRAILQCLASGLADKQIADRLELSLHAVDYHMRQLRKRFGARNRMQLVPQALRVLEAG